MAIKIKILCVIILSGISWLTTYNNASAEITAFTTNPASLNSGQLTSLVWSSQNTSAVKIILPCLRGIKYKNESGNGLNCANPISELAVNGAYNLSVFNLNTVYTPVQIKTVPKNPAGVYEESNYQTATVNIAPTLTVINDFSASIAEIESGGEIQFNWSAISDVPGVNFIFSCPDNTKVVYVSDTRPYLPCGTIALTTDLGISSGIKFKFFNYLGYSRTFNVTLVPALGDGTYDASRGRTVAVTITPPVPKVPLVKIYSPSPLFLPSGSSTIISWGGSNNKGVNFLLPCAYGLSATSSQNATSTLVCGSYAFQNNLEATSTMSFSFKNTANGAATVQLKVVPYTLDNNYDATRAVEIPITVLPEKSVSSVTTVATPAASVSATTSTSSTTAASTVVSAAQTSTPAHTFTRPLYYGLTNDADVKALQQILFKEGFYSGPITGNYFSLTVAGVKKFQSKYGIAPLGNVGPATRTKLNEISRASLLVQTAATASSTQVSASFRFQNPLYYGMQNNEDVKKLQEILLKEGLFNNPVSGNYFSLTVSAVKKFQSKYGLEPLGNVGPATREKLNAILNGEKPAITQPVNKSLDLSPGGF